MSAIPLGAKVIANWQPSDFEYSTVYDEFSQLVEKLCGESVWELDEPVTVREAKWRNQSHNLEFHRDNYDGVENIWVVVWTNQLSTEVRLTDGATLSTKDGDVLLLDNFLVEHRTPADNNDNANRWFARAMIAKRMSSFGWDVYPER